MKVSLNSKEGRMEDNILVKPSFSATINALITHIRRRYRMTRIAFLLIAVVTVACVVASMAPASGQADGEAAPIFVTKIPPGYRDWRLISVAHEEGTLNDIRAILGNDIAIKAYREGKLPFPEGSIIARVAWSYVLSEENNKIFGRAQSFVAGPPTNGVQFMVKDSRKYAATGGWGVRSFQRWQTCRRGSAPKLLSLPPGYQILRPCLHPLLTLLLRTKQ